MLNAIYSSKPLYFSVGKVFIAWIATCCFDAIHFSIQCKSKENSISKKTRLASNEKASRGGKGEALSKAKLSFQRCKVA
ncbi:hypothetical protein CW749_02975 [Vibrio sp. vnigr-6D03]|nr:hypothetical protein CW749_02975 [Vibrio sp. vnigr-6D03]